MRLNLGLGLTSQRSGAPALTLSQQVEAILTGTNGFALDTSDISTLFQDTAAATPVTAINDPVGRINSKWGLVSRNFVQGTAGFRPAWTGGSLDYDGTDDALGTSAASPIFQNAPAAFITARCVTDNIAQRTIMMFSTNAANNHRFSATLDASNVLYMSGRRLDADAEVNAVSGAAGAVTINVPFTFSWEADYAGTRAFNGYLNGSPYTTGTLFATAGNTSNTTSASVTIGTYTTGIARWRDKIGRMVICPFLPTSGQRAVFEAWVAEVAL
jgi:hypothetical protein